jgi:thymidylate kinase
LLLDLSILPAHFSSYQQYSDGLFLAVDKMRGFDSHSHIGPRSNSRLFRCSLEVIVAALKRSACPSTDDMYESFVEYHSRIAGQFDRMVEDYGFEVINASRSIEEVFADLKSQVSDILANANPVLAESISSSRQFHNGQ